MLKYETDELAEARRLLTNFEATADPEQRIQEFEAGINLLDNYVHNHQPLDEDTAQWIKQLRSSCIKNLLSSLTKVRGGSITP